MKFDIFVFERLVIVSILFFIIEFLEDDGATSQKRSVSASFFKKSKKLFNSSTGFETDLSTQEPSDQATAKSSEKFKWFKSGSAEKDSFVNVSRAEQNCDYSSNQRENLEFFNQEIFDDDYHTFTPLIEAQLLQFTLEERMFYWTIHILASKTHESRMRIVDLYDRLLLDQKRQRFHEKLAAEMANDLPFTHLLLSSMTKTTGQINEFSMSFYLDNELNELENVASIVRMLVDLSLEDRLALRHSFEIQGRSLEYELARTVESSEISDLLVQLLNAKNSVNIASDQTAIHEQVKLLKAKMLPINSTHSKDSARRLLMSFKSVQSSLKNSCSLLRLDARYCALIGFVESYHTNKTVHSVNRLRSIIIRGVPTVELIWSLLKATTSADKEENMEAIETMYESVYGIKLAKHFEMFFRHEPEDTGSPKPWWKFWAREHVSEKQILIRALQAFIRYPVWCRNDCDVTQKFKKIKPKSRNPFSKIFRKSKQKASDGKNEKAGKSSITRTREKLKKKVISSVL